MELRPYTIHFTIKSITTKNITLSTNPITTSLASPTTQTLSSSTTFSATHTTEVTSITEKLSTSQPATTKAAKSTSYLFIALATSVTKITETREKSFAIEKYNTVGKKFCVSLLLN